MTRVAALALALLLAMAASAQDLNYSDTGTMTCIDQTPVGHSIASCAGTSAEFCMSATPDGYTTVGMGFCLDQELTFWDNRLNASYQKVLARAKVTDAELDGLQSAAPRQEEALRRMQRAWITFRDAACEYEYTQWSGGTGGGPAYASCKMRLTAEQTARLETWQEG